MFTYVKASRGDWVRHGFRSHAEWVRAFTAWAATAARPEERAHVAAEASYLLSLPGFGAHAEALAPLTREA